MPALDTYHPSNSIHPLPKQLANQIAAGEVVERPVSIVKELIENALDAGATRIAIDIQKGGMQAIRVQDNGYGIRREELPLAVSRHATSKIVSLDDLEHIKSMGFRGEALASMSSVSRLHIMSKYRDSQEAWQLRCGLSNADPELQPIAHPAGTTVEVHELFFNTPARRKFLRSERTEYRHIEDMFKRIALSRFDIAFSLSHNQRQVFQLAGVAEASGYEGRVKRLCGKAFVQQAVVLDFSASGLRLWGWVATPEASRPQADLQYVYVNGRVIRDRLISHALRQAYQDQIYPGRHPAYVLFLELDPAQLDVNVHPTKHEVRFRESRLAHDFLSHCVSRALQEATPDGDHTVAHPAAVSLAYHKAAPGRAQPAQAMQSTMAGGAQPRPHKFVAAEAPAEYINETGAEVEQQASPLGRALALLHKRYILAQNETGLVVLDRVVLRAYQLKQELRRLQQANIVKSKPLLISQSLSLGEGETERVTHLQSTFQALGFDMSVISKDTVLLRHVPSLMAHADPQQVIVSWLAALRQEPAGNALESDIVTGTLAQSIAENESADYSLSELNALLQSAYDLSTQAEMKTLYASLDLSALDKLIKHGSY